MKGTKTGQGLRINQVKYQIIKTVTDENSQCYSVSGKKVSFPLQLIYIPRVNPHFLVFVLTTIVLSFNFHSFSADNGWLWSRAVWQVYSHCNI